MSRPRLPILRHMARSGGTLISRCLGCMDSVRLLSEIHPLATSLFNPAAQACEWFGLVTPGEVKAWKTARRPFDQTLAEISRRVRAQGRTLVVREWTHLDAVGHPFVRPTGRWALGEAMRGRTEPTAAYTCRHPLDQWLSFSRLEVAQGLPVGAYLRGCVLFAEWAAADGGAMKYEDFCAEPARQLGGLCERLGVKFDPSWEHAWASYTTITGDNAQSGARAAGESTIRPLERRAAPEGLLERFRANTDYRRACELLGYEP